MLYKATKYKYAEDANIAWGCKGKKRDNQDDARLDRRRKSTWTNEKREDSRSRPVGRTISFTPLNAPLEQVFMQVKDDPTLKWPDKLKSDPINARGTSNVESILTIGMTPSIAMTWSNKLKPSLNKGSYSNLLGEKGLTETP